MKNNKGFISTTMVVSVIILAIGLTFLIIRQFEVNSFFAHQYTQAARERLATTKHPNCFWGRPPLMRRHPTTGMATTVLTLECTHVDGIVTPTNAIVNNLTIRRRGNNNPIPNNIDNLQTRWLNLNLIPNGFQIAFEIQSRAPGDYSITLNANAIRTRSNFGNFPIASTDLTGDYILVRNYDFRS